MEKQFTIGQLANLFDINIQTLYFYDKIGLFKPSSRNNLTGIRIYSVNKIYELSTILYLKKCGFDLQEIREIQNNLTPETAKDKLTKKSKQLRKQWLEIMRIDDSINNKLEYVDKEKKLQDKEENQIIYRKKRYYQKAETEKMVYSTDFLYFCPIVVVYTPGVRVFGALMEKNNPVENDNQKLLTIPNGNYYVCYYKGPYNSIYEYMDNVVKDHTEIDFTDTIYSFNIIDQFNSSNQENYLTRMEFQIKK